MEDGGSSLQKAGGTTQLSTFSGFGSD
ncbi:hypothetical protein YQE_00888, partial [Dendroctonus ponderosae]